MARDTQKHFQVVRLLGYADAPEDTALGVGWVGTWVGSDLVHVAGSGQRTPPLPLVHTQRLGSGIDSVVDMDTIWNENGRSGVSPVGVRPDDVADR